MTELRLSTDGEWTVRKILEWTIGYLRKQGSDSPRLDAEVLLAHAWNCSRIQLYTHYDVVLPEDVRAVMRDLVKRRAAAEPVAYLVGHREFYSLDFEVGPGVFIPRPATEYLVLAALEWMQQRPPADVLELCAGTGCVSVAIAANNRDASVCAVELSPEALLYTRRNVNKHLLTDRITVVKGDLFSGLPSEQKFDVIVSNPPYVMESEMQELPADIRCHEPALALRAGADGLSIVRRIAEQVAPYLKRQAILLLELNPQHAEEAVQLFQKTNLFSTVELASDIDQVTRFLRAVR